MIRHCLALLAMTFCAAAAAGGAAAQSGAPAPGRYAFVPVAEGTLRLDTATGTVSLCSGRGADLACRPLREDAANAETLRDLEARLAAIEAELAARRGRDAEGDMDGDTDGLPTLKDEEAVERMMDLAERMMRRFFDMVEEFRDEGERQRI